MELVWIAAIAAGTLHVLIFAMESLWFRRPEVQRRFGVRGELPETTRLFAFNQGFYNLFLAIGMFVGLGLLVAGREQLGLILIVWNALSMLAAALVLAFSAPGMLRGAIIQGTPALLTLLAAMAT